MDYELDILATLTQLYEPTTQEIVSVTGISERRVQNAYIERANRTIRYSWVSKHLFETLEQVQEYATEWLWFYNHERPHKANNGKPPLMAS